MPFPFTGPLLRHPYCADRTRANFCPKQITVQKNENLTFTKCHLKNNSTHYILTKYKCSFKTSIRYAPDSKFVIEFASKKLFHCFFFMKTV